MNFLAQSDKFIHNCTFGMMLLVVFDIDTKGLCKNIVLFFFFWQTRTLSILACSQKYNYWINGIRKLEKLDGNPHSYSNIVCDLNLLKKKKVIENRRSLGWNGNLSQLEILHLDHFLRWKKKNSHSPFVVLLFACVF